MKNVSNKISVFGLGYVGCITSCCLAYLRQNVIGVDIDPYKIELINAAIPPISEPLFDEYLNFAIKNNYLTTTTDVSYAIENSDVSFICVSTPSSSDGSCNLSAVHEIITNIAKALDKKKSKKQLSDNKHIIVIRSTIPPGTIENVIIPLLEQHSALRNNHDFLVCFYPEFLREARAIEDFFNPALFIIGENDTKEASNRIIKLMYPCLNRYNDIIIKTDYKTSELIKYIDNIWHAMKVTFANEVGTLAKCYSVEARDLMEIFCSNHKLNISSYYLTPGLSYGGSCLPKDLKHIEYLIKQKNLQLPLIGSINNSNKLHIERTYDFIIDYAGKNLGWYGLTFKPDTDDLRSSVQLEIFSRLSQKYNTKFFDKNIIINKITPASHEILKNKINNYNQLCLNNIIELLEHSDTLVLGHPLNDELIGIIHYYLSFKPNIDSQLVIIDLNKPNVKFSLSSILEGKIKYYNIF